MKVIGITGGVGAGKSTVLTEIKKICNCRIITADILAKELQLPGGRCYQSIIELLGLGILQNDSAAIDNKKMADVIFSDQNKLKAVNDIIHPAVKEEILEIIEFEQKNKKIDYLFIEAALLIEEGYDVICDRIWYIYASEPVRRGRLKASRGYSDEKIDNILKKQCSEEAFRKNCKDVINNDGDLAKTIDDIKTALNNLGEE